MNSVNWSSIRDEVIAGLILAAIALVPAILRLVKPNLFHKLIDPIKPYWKLLCAVLMLIGSLVSTFTINNPLMNTVLQIGVFAFLVYHYQGLRRKHYTYPATSTNDLAGIALASKNALGVFSETENGPWKPAVECQVDPSWKVLKGARWIWIKRAPSNLEAEEGQIVWYQYEFFLPEHLVVSSLSATLMIAVDDAAEIWLNNQRVNKISILDKVISLPVAAHLQAGRNVLRMRIENVKRGPGATGESNPAGVIYRLTIQSDS